MPAPPHNSTPPPEVAPETAPRPEELSPEDFYLEGHYVVFTASYHLKRGYCCKSDCRHCPYGDPAATGP